MKQAIILFASLFLIINSQAQDIDSILPRIVKDTLFTTCGYRIVVGQEITFGNGTMPDGDFKYIRISRNSLLGYGGSDNTGANSRNSINRKFNGQHFKVINVDKVGRKKHGYNYLAFIRWGLGKVEIDADAAIEAGEIVVPNHFKIKPVPTATVIEVKSQISIADELTKLKNLLDDGVLTQAEFDAQKKKLLEQK